QINGLHCLQLKIAAGKLITKAGVVTDLRFNKVYKASVTIGNGTKLGTFFPDDWSIEKVKTTVTEAWRDWKTFGNSDKSSSIYKGLKEKYGLSWVGLAVFKDGGAEQKLWIGAKGAGEGDKPILTAFPAVNNKFF
ncbi:MAG TPA: hypothetical protein PLZ81_18005, partial [Acidiphilium rubrum]|nr:hypothetical protein [Acidiphilium rubrum]